MTRPRAFEASSSFFGAERNYTRQRLYRRDDSDLRAAAHDEPLDRVRSGYSVPLKDLDEDPYEEAGHVGVFEQQQAIQQFRSDARSGQFRELVRQTRRIGTMDADDPIAVAEGTATNPQRSTLRSLQEMADARKRQARTRSEILRVMERQAQQRTLFTVNYAGCVPQRFVDEFLSTVEAASVCDALVPMLHKLEYSGQYDDGDADDADEMATHMEEGQLVRVMYNAGCVLERADTIDVVGHLRDHVRDFEDEIDRRWYTPGMIECEHAHYERAENRTRIRQLTFQIPTAAAEAEDAELRDVSDAAGYRVKVITHLVEESPDRTRVAYNVLCFRSFHFTRYF